MFLTVPDSRLVRFFESFASGLINLQSDIQHPCYQECVLMTSIDVVG